MIISFDISEDDTRTKRRFLQYAHRITNNPILVRTKELDEFFCNNPVTAVLYLNLIVKKEYKARKTLLHDYTTIPRIIEPEKNRISKNLENIFSKSTVYAMNYLFLTGQTRFEDDKLNKKIMNRIFNNPHYSFFYSAFLLNKRLPEDKEFVFLKSYKALYHYSKIVVKEKFSGDIEKKIILDTFKNEYKEAGPLKYRYGSGKDIDYLKFYVEEYDKDYTHYWYARKLQKFH